jgi:dephospho-CoA kinase
MHTRPAEKPVIGVVGGIGAGKSTVAAELARLGCARIDADAVGHRLLETDQVRRELRRCWGDAVFDAQGRTDRRAISSIVFQDRSALERLNEVMHPRMRRRLKQQIARARQRPDVPAVVLDAAVLFEAGWDDLCSDVVFVSAPASARKRRARATRGWDEATWRSREKQQISLDRKSERCSYTLDNSSDIPCLLKQVRRLFGQIVCGAENPE